MNMEFPLSAGNRMELLSPDAAALSAEMKYPPQRGIGGPVCARIKRRNQRPDKLLCKTAPLQSRLRRDSFPSGDAEKQSGANP